MTVVVGFHCDVTDCELARRSVWRGAAKTSSTGGLSPARVGVVTRGRSDLDPRSIIEGSFPVAFQFPTILVNIGILYCTFYRKCRADTFIAARQVMHLTKNTFDKFSANEKACLDYQAQLTGTTEFAELRI